MADVTCPLDLGGPLPGGRVVIEASAGTGKTYAVAGLVTRLVVERDLPVDRVLVTTFTRAAARELRQRIRERLAGAVRLLSGAAPPGDDAVAAALVRTPDAAEHARRLRRATTALTEFELATIGTIHAFCQRLLRWAGEDGGVTDGEPEPGDRLVAEAVNDLLVREALAGRATSAAGGTIDAGRLATIVRKRLANPAAVAWVEHPGDPGLARARTLVEAAVTGVLQRPEAHRTYDGLLRRANQLVTRDHDARVREAVASRYHLAVVDEAQDTDPLQWALLDALFPATDPARSLFVVGDPKQSIYGFRGADVEGYVRARAGGAVLCTLDRNFRSSPPMLDVLNTLLQGAGFGTDIGYRSVAAGRRDTPDVPGPAVELVVAESPTVSEARLDRLAAQRVAAALHATTGDPAVAAGEVAVLVGTGWQARRMVRALAAHGVAAITAGTESVAVSEAAHVLRHLLRALERPGHLAAARLAAVEWFGDVMRAQLAGNGDEALVATQERLAGLSGVLRRHGVSALLEQELRSPRVLERLAATGRLERHLTDLTHLAELLHEGTGRRGASPGDVLDALAALARLDARAELVTRRIESDREAVQVLTVHAAKGLQWPMVVVARPWPAPKADTKDPPAVRLGTGDDGRVLDCGWLIERPSDRATAAAREAAAAEEARLLYVALTRAEDRLVVLLTPDGEERGTATRCFGFEHALRTADELRTGLARRLEPVAGHVRILAAAEAGAPPAYAGDAAGDDTGPVLEPAPPLTRPVIAARRRWSFTSVATRLARAGDEAGGEDEWLGSDPITTPSVTVPTGPLATIPTGTDVGTAVHAVLEAADFSARPLPAALAPLLARHADSPVLRPHHARLANGLARALETPLGAAGDAAWALADVARTDRLDELGFDLALGTEGPGPSMAAIGGLLGAHLADGDPLQPYARRLADDARPVALTGLLTGFIDLVVRRPSTGAFVVADYKTNRLPAYDQATLAATMASHHYALQGLLYLAALHRWLRWRLGEADPSPRLPGMAFLFLRGMVGPDTPRDAAGRPDGVFWWTPPVGLLPALSDLLGGSR